MSRPQRNRRLSRRIWSPDNNLNHCRPFKRLFTPEIKRMLKDWLVRRRENPYPSREEKKLLSSETGLTYTQICNWFANWRRKLKNSEHQKAMNSWGTLIKNYNTNARGNVEQFSISSEDSIWEEAMNAEDGDGAGDDDDDDDYDDDYDLNDVNLRGENRMMYKKSGFRRVKEDYEPYYVVSHCGYRTNSHGRTIKMDNSNSFSNNNSDELKEQCLQETTKRSSCLVNCDDKVQVYSPTNLKCDYSSVSTHNPKYKQKMMEKYLRDTYEQDQKIENDIIDVETTEVSGAAELSKWLESAAKFTPNKNNYFVEWNERNKRPRTLGNGFNSHNSQEISAAQSCTSIHHKDELDAAEALANLAFNCRQRMCAVNE